MSLKVGVRYLKVQESHAQVEEDDAVHRGAQHGDEVLDGCLRFVGNIFEGVMSLDNSTADERDNSYKMVAEAGGRVGEWVPPDQWTSSASM